MRVRVWGCRGSLAAPGPENIRYGGNTSCVEVTAASGETFVLDAGTGMRPLGVSLAQAGIDDVHVLLSHLHLDHLQGLGFFRPLFDPNVRVRVWGPPSPVQPLADRISTYLSPPLFPVRLADIPSAVSFHDAPEQAITVGSVTIRAALVTHQGPTVGYRIEEAGRAITYLPDHEPSLGGIDLADQPADWISGHDLAAGADVLLHDAQYGDAEYPNHVGWGHSSIGHVVAFARKADVDNLVLFHHDPYHSDVELEALAHEARALWGDGCECVYPAWEGMTMELDADGVRVEESPVPG